MYTQQSAKNSLEGRGNYIGQDDIQAHFHLLCDHDIPILHVGNTGQDHLFMAEENGAQKGDCHLPKHTSKWPGELENYPRPADYTSPRP